MTLAEYLSQSGLTREAFARLVDAHPVTVAKWATGKMLPRRAAMRLIEEVTHGAVKPADFFAEEAA